MLDHVDLLAIAGIDRTTFYSNGEDVQLDGGRDEEPRARVFRKGSKLVYRAGNSVDWYGDRD